MQFAIKKPQGVFWKPGLTFQQIQNKLQAGEIAEDWLVCPQGEAEHAVLISEFLARPSIFGSDPAPQKDLSEPLPISTSNDLPGKILKETVGVVFGEAIMGANIFRDIAAGIRDIVGGRSGAYESKLREGRALAIEEMIAEARQLGANAVISVKIDYETIGPNGGMLMICATGTAVTVEQQNGPGIEDNSRQAEAPNAT